VNRHNTRLAERSASTLAMVLPTALLLTLLDVAVTTGDKSGEARVPGEHRNPERKGLRLMAATALIRSEHSMFAEQIHRNGSWTG
jgi:hypothetical protein